MIFHGEIYAGIGYEDLADSVRIMRTTGLSLVFRSTEMSLNALITTATT